MSVFAQTKTGGGGRGGVWEEHSLSFREAYRLPYASLRKVKNILLRKQVEHLQAPVST